MSGWFDEDESTGEIRAGIYLRISTLDQKEGHGMQLQKTRCEAMATVKGWKITKVYQDEGVSGTIKETNRPGFKQLIKDVKGKEIDALIVYALDRLGRRTQIVLRTIENLSSMGIKVVSCRENLDTSTPTGTFMVTIFAALSQLERDTIVERMKAGIEERRKIDGDTGGPVPTGYKRENGTVVMEEEKAETIRHIFHRRYIDFRYIYEIADELNEKKVPMPTKRGKRWGTGILQGILDNEAKYRGGFRNRSKFRWPRILPEDFDEQEARARQAHERDLMLNLPDPESGSSEMNTQKVHPVRGERKIARSKRALELLKQLEEGEPISAPIDINIPKKLIRYKEAVEYTVEPKTPSPRRILNIPSPENARKIKNARIGGQPSKSSKIEKSPKIPKTDQARSTVLLNIPPPANPRVQTADSPSSPDNLPVPALPKRSTTVSSETVPPRPPPTTRIRLRPKHTTNKKMQYK